MTAGWRIDSTVNGNYVVMPEEDGSLNVLGPFDLAAADHLLALLNRPTPATPEQEAERVVADAALLVDSTFDAVPYDRDAHWAACGALEAATAQLRHIREADQ